MEKITNSTVTNLIDQISSKEPVPGGGAVSAMSASIAASLCEMVTGLTIGKKRYEAYDEETKNKINEIASISKELKGEFLELFEMDNQAFQKVMEAFRLPKETDEQKAQRKGKIEESYIGAMEVPLDVAKKIMAFYPSIEFMAQYGNPNCITDVGVASLQALSAMEGAIFNVKINLTGISQEELVREANQECDNMIIQAKEIHEKIMNKVKEAF